MVIPNLSRALTLLVRQARIEQEAAEDLDAFHAPGECYPLVERGLARERRHLRRRIHALCGVPLRVVMREARRRTSGSCLYKLGLGVQP